MLIAPADQENEFRQIRFRANAIMGGNTTHPPADFAIS
jgi:hypothetical protein